MGVKVEFQPADKIIQVTQAPVLTDGEWVVELDVKIDLYSDGKEDWENNGLGLNKFRFPLVSVGGNPLPGSKALGATFFLADGWKIRPYESNHVFRVNGNLYREDGVSPYTSTLGSYNVLQEATVSSLVDSTVQQLAEIQYSSFGGGVSLDINYFGPYCTGVEYPSGNKEFNTNNLTDAVAIAGDKFDVLFIKSSMTGANKLDSGTDINGFTLVGKSDVITELELDASLLCGNVAIMKANVYGVLDGGSHISACSVGNVSYMNGHIENSGMYGIVWLDGDEDAVISNCKTIDQDRPLIVDMGVSGQSLAMPNYSGLVTVRNLHSEDDEIGIGLNHGHVILEDTITQANYIIISGIGTHTDNTPDDVFVDVSGLTNPAAVAEAIMTYDRDA